MDREPSHDSLRNYEMALQSAIANGCLTEDEADLAMQAFIEYEFGDLIDFQQSLDLRNGSDQ